MSHTRSLQISLHAGKYNRAASVSQNSSTKSAMEKLLASCAPHIDAAMRIIVGLLFACHGAQKLFGVFGGLSGAAAPLFSLMGLAGIIEFFGGSLVAAGWLTGFIAFLASGEMAAAYFMEHLPIGFWPTKIMASCQSSTVLFFFTSRAGAQVPGASMQLWGIGESLSKL